MILTVLMTLEGSSPEMSRLLNVEGDVHLHEFAPLIDAAFGFSGTADHLYMRDSDGERTLFSPTPTDGEEDESMISLGDIDVLTYVYDPAASWTIRLETLGVTEMDTPSPMLIDAAGPDVIEACGGPEMMSAFHLEARRLAAGLEPDMKVSPLLLSFMPVMSPERLIQRLSHVDHPTVAERIAFTAENLYLNASDELVDDPRAPEIANEFDAFVDSRPDLQHILSLDPNPERNPALIAAISEFFSDHAPDSKEDLYPFTRVVSNVRTFVRHCERCVTLDSNGHLRAPDARTLAESFGVHEQGPVEALRTTLEIAGVLVSKGETLCTTVVGAQTAAEPVRLLSVLVDALEAQFTPAQLWWAAALAGMDTAGSTVGTVQSPMLVELFIGLGIFEPGSSVNVAAFTDPGEDVLRSFLGQTH